MSDSLFAFLTGPLMARLIGGARIRGATPSRLQQEVAEARWMHMKFARGVTGRPV